MKKKVKIDILQGENENTKIFVMSQDIRGLSTYETAKAITNFINKETKVLETCIDTHLRHVLISHGIIPQDGSNECLARAINEFKYKHGKSFDITNRYINTKEDIVGEKDEMTVINEDGILSCAIEIEVINCG
ncbi:MAG: hypothetical protein J6S85_16455 [Methanobrevibacter sp.]|nr:hypothetical protein [Methanobrevibacter sp.]